MEKNSKNNNSRATTIRQVRVDYLHMFKGFFDLCKSLNNEMAVFESELVSRFEQSSEILIGFSEELRFCNKANLKSVFEA